MSSLKIAIRADSGSIIGSGHIMRCLTLALKLRDVGHEVMFLSKPHKGHVMEMVEAKGFKIESLEKKSEVGSLKLVHSSWLAGSQQDDVVQSIDKIHTVFGKNADWVVIDHYGIGEEWEQRLIDEGSKIFVIDDLADRKHCCNLLLDQTYGRENEDYQSLVPQNCQLLLGSKFALLRDDFSIPRLDIIEQRQKGFDNGCRRVLVMMGGTDHLNITSYVLQCLVHDRKTAKVTVVLGDTAVHQKEIDIYCFEREKFELKVGVSNVAELMMNHDICFGAAGATSWERCALGLPSLVAVVAENQKNISENLVNEGAIKSFSSQDPIDTVLNDLNKLRERDVYFDVLNRCVDVCDGLGTQRVLQRLLNGKN